MSQPLPDATQLKEFYASWVSAQAVLDVLASGTRGQKTTELLRLSMDLREAGTARPSSELILVLRKLGRLGYGTFITGRRGHPTRFEWAYDPVSVGVAAGGIKPVQKIESFIDETTERNDAFEAPEEMNALDHRYRLRADWIVDLRLPVDLTAWEATRLSDFIKTLPFEGKNREA